MKNCKSLALGGILAVLALPLLGAASDASAQNLLTNPDFETGDLTGWVAFGLSGSSNVTVEGTDNGPSFPGSNFAFLDNQAEALGLGVKQTTAPGSASGGQVNYAYDLKLDEANVGGVVFVEIFAEAEGVGIVGGSGLMGPLWPWEWTAYSGSFVAPANTSFLTIQFVATTGANIDSSCVLRVDNVILEMDGAVATEESSWSNVKALYR